MDQRRKEDRRGRRVGRGEWKQAELFAEAKAEKEVRIITWN